MTARPRRAIEVSLFAAALLGVPALAHASPPAESFAPAGSDEGVSPLVSGALDAQECQWPSVVALPYGDDLCTGTLIHPEIIVTAAHCGVPEEAIFGEDMFNPARTVPIAYCLDNPDYDTELYNGVNGGDYAFCRLVLPVDDVPITPPVFGCGVDELQLEASATIIGFGNTDGNQGYGTKRWAQVSVLTELDDTDTLVVGEVGSNVCLGDSGGPAMLQYEDGSWHVFGIVTGGSANCGAGYGYFALVHEAAAFIEEFSNIDVTPCHDIDGTWNPGPDCKAFTTEPLLTQPAWDEGCPAPGPALPLSTCGEPFVTDVDAPSVAITSPEDGASYTELEITLDVSVDASDAESGVASVELTLDGESVAVDDEAPWLFEGITLDSGEHELTAFATDGVGNVAESDDVVVIVGDVGDTSEDTGTETTGTEDTGETEAGSEEESSSGGDDEVGSEEDSGGEGDPGIDDGGGCGCSTAASAGRPGDGAAGLLGLALFGLGFGAARRRRAWKHGARRS